MAQITGVSIVCSTADQRKYQSSTSLAFVRGIHRWPLYSPCKEPATKMFPFAAVIMIFCGLALTGSSPTRPSSPMRNLYPKYGSLTNHQRSTNISLYTYISYHIYAHNKHIAKKSLCHRVNMWLIHRDYRPEHINHTYWIYTYIITHVGIKKSLTSEFPCFKMIMTKHLARG